MGLTRGIAQYWQARPITLLSKANLKVVQVSGDLRPYRALNHSEPNVVENQAQCQACYKGSPWVKVRAGALWVAESGRMARSKAAASRLGQRG